MLEERLTQTCWVLQCDVSLPLRVQKKGEIGAHVIGTEKAEHYTLNAVDTGI